MTEETSEPDSAGTDSAGGLAFMARARRGMTDLQAIGAHIFRRMAGDNLFGVAAALTYTSLLALVPLIAIAVAVLTAFPVFDEVRAQLQDFLFNNFLPDVGIVVQDYLTAFVGATGRLTAVGVGGLAVTALMMLMTIEQSFNTIFRVARARGVLARLLVYWTVLTLGPLLIGVSFSISSYLAAAGEDILTDRAVSMWTRVSWVVPYLLTLGAFTLLYATVPNRVVRLRDAFIGALIAATLFAGLRYGFLLFVASAGTYQTIYGAMAALPLFLMWMYLSWAVVLAGAVITAALPEWRMRRGPRLSGGEVEARLALALDIMAALGRTQRFGRGLPRNRLLALTAAAEDTLIDVLEDLHCAHLLAPTAEGQWVLTRPLADVTLNDLLRVIGAGVPSDPPAVRGEGWAGPVHAALARARAAQKEALGMPLDRLVLPPPVRPLDGEAASSPTHRVGH